MARTPLPLLLLLALALLTTACAPQPAADSVQVNVTRVDVVSQAVGATVTAVAAQPTGTEVPAWQRPEMFTYIGTSNFDGVDRDVVMPYYLFTPKDMSYTARYPLIIMLHGAGISANDAMTLEPPVLPRPMLENPDEYAAFRASPLLPAGLFWWQVPDTVSAFAADLLRQYPIDPDRVILMGFSNGGGGVMSVAAYYPELFAAFVPIAGFWPYQGRDERDLSLLCGAADRGFYVYHGNVDEIIPWQESEKLVNTLRDDCDADDVVWDLVTGVDHVGAVLEANHKPEVYEWTFAQLRPGGE